MERACLRGGLEAIASGACGRNQGPCKTRGRRPREPFPRTAGGAVRGLVPGSVLPVFLPLPARLVFLPGRKLLLTLRFWR